MLLGSISPRLVLQTVYAFMEKFECPLEQQFHRVTRQPCKNGC